MATIFHKGTPCDPPIVNGITFADRGDDVYTADVPDDQAEELLLIPAYSLDDPSVEKPSKGVKAGR